MHANPMTDDEAREKARELWADDDLEIDDDAIVSPTDTGAWVQAWVYVPAPTDDE